ncbi:spore coat U domain-containing protein [Marinobacter sp.]|uniref:Csu type fimbrial protein n=1 Tax=Marinobacter sp. TaxID=50741 RepID=UPI0035683774
MKRAISHPLPVLFILLVVTLGMPRSAEALLEWCEVDAIGVDFGSYDPLNASDTESTGNVAVTCKVSLAGLIVTYQIELSTGGSGTYFPREMTSGTSKLDYQLYTGAGRITVWGDGTGASDTQNFSALVQIGTHTENFPVYGSMPSGQMVSAGSYSDTITVTVIY